MRAAVFKGAGQPLVCEEVATPVPGEGEVVLKVGFCGICGTDLHRTESNILTYDAGTIMGHEFSGEVAALGPGVTTLKVGDRVTAMPYLGCNECEHCRRGFPVLCKSMRNVGTNDHPGAYAQYVVTSERFTFKLPQSLSLEDGALIEPLAVGLRGVNRTGVEKGQSVLVIGAGPIGLAAAFWAKQRGAAKVAVQASSARRAELAGELGADLFIMPQDGVSPARTAVNAMGGEPDVVLECVGGVGLIDQAMPVVRPQGVVGVLGLCPHQESWLPVRGLAKEIDIRFSLVYEDKDYHTALDTLDRGAVAPRAMVTDTVSLDELPSAFEALRSRSPQCKVLVRPN
ncbi:alcohol dehydrogenase catalytic domain-containing protein [Phenylobacterium sp.]|uniref:alcohol dehydrogenase catalytic domain-containing protein n=1 Tax=Phenylobacterium sp. TaxID=1871053 RepID=UPI0035B1E931